MTANSEPWWSSILVVMEVLFPQSRCRCLPVDCSNLFSMFSNPSRVSRKSFIWAIF